MKVFFCLATCGLLLSCMASWAGRFQLSLDGRWEFVKVGSLDDPLPTSGWQPINVPGTLYGFNYERAWFHRKFTLPQEWQGYRIILRFGGVKYNSRVLVNGKHVGGLFNGYDAFELDITSAVRFGEENDLLVGVHDWTGVFKGEEVNFAEALARGSVELREVPYDRVISPIGGHFANYGIWNSVYLLAVPPVHISEIFIRPSIRQKRLEVDVKITNSSDRECFSSLRGEIFPWDGKERDKTGQWGIKGKAVAGFPSLQFSLAPGESKTLTLRLDNPPLENWSPYNPRLYVLELRIDQPNGDILRERFGYREFWTEGGDFYLNGKKVHLLASSWWPSTQGVSRDFVLNQLLALKKMNAVAFRTHTQPWQDIYYEVADEIGLMMIPEGAVWNDDTTYRVFDPEFWKNYADHLRSMVRHLRNHPSVVMWSLENEFYGSRVNPSNPDTEENLAMMGRIVKREDPTRPITYESDGDPGGVADVIGIHYPNEFPEKRLWPNDAYWLDEPRYIWGGGGMFWKGPFLWDRKKPLYIGEYLWVPAREPSPNTLFFGDDAYRNLQQYRTKAKAEAWRMQILAYRHYEVSGHSPWTVIEQGPLDETNPCWVAQRDMYRPLAGFVMEYDSRFFSGERIQRIVELFNDTMKDLPRVSFKWFLLDGKSTLQQGKETLAMESGAHLKRVINIDLPEVRSRKQLTLRITLEAPGVPSFREDYKIEVFPRLTSTLLPPFQLYDPDDKLAPTLRRMGIAFQKLNALGDWEGKDILVIAPSALKAPKRSERPLIGGDIGEEQLLYQRISEGSKALVLEQDKEAGDWLPIALDNQSSTMSFPLLAHHPILAGMDSTDLRFWRGDNLVSVNEPTRPLQAGALPLVVTGGAQGLSHSPLVEVRQGKGVWLICQLRVASKLETEPMASILLARMLEYLAHYTPPQGEVRYVVSPEMEENLRALRIEGAPLRDWQELRFPTVRLLLLQGNVELTPERRRILREFLQAGGQVLWHRPTRLALSRLREALDLRLTLQPYNGPVARAEGEGEILSNLTREDLYWLGAPSGPWWREVALATDSADGVFLAQISPSKAKLFPATEKVKMEGPVGIQEKELFFWANGRAEWEIDLPETGTYNWGLVARGTPVGGIYPLVDVFIDGERVGMLYIGSEEPQTYTLPFKAKKGKHILSIAFINDAYSPPEDRNLWVQSFLLAKATDRENLELVTSPPALVSIPLGKGRLVLNSLRWEEPPAGNGLKARRFISSLLNALGATFAPRSVSILKAEVMEPEGEIPFFRKEAGYVYLGGNGTLRSEVEVAREGDYRITIWARGTPVGGIYPVVVLEMDGKEIGRVECKGEDWSPHSLIAHLPPGRHVLRLSFINDEWRPPEDRNLWLSQIEFEALK